MFNLSRVGVLRRSMKIVEQDVANLEIHLSKCKLALTLKDDRIWWPGLFSFVSRDDGTFLFRHSCSVPRDQTTLLVNRF